MAVVVGERCGHRLSWDGPQPGVMHSACDLRVLAWSPNLTKRAPSDEGSH